MNKKCRIKFEKAGRAKYISHLDLMRTFQHSFVRSGIKIWHTEGFNPHPYISIALPLQLGCESYCEILDIILSENDDLSLIPDRMNPYLPEGIKIISAWEPVAKVGTLKYAKCCVRLFYDDHSAGEKVLELEKIFKLKPVMINKKTKRGFSEIDLSEHISGVEVLIQNSDEVLLAAIISAANPTINPSNMVDAIKKIRPELSPDYAQYMRMEIYDEKMQVFR